jgi:predicted transcriptional regulator
MSGDFKKIFSSLEDHLQSINDNSAEIQSLFDYLQELELKMDRISSRLDEVQIQHEHMVKKDVQPLNHLEKQIFLVLYTEEFAMTVPDICEKTKLPSSVVQERINTIITKGVPLVRSYVDKQVYIQIDGQFKERQAKENLVNLSLDSFY